MRLNKTIIAKIKDAVQNSFGNVEVYLFGSRVDDSKKGGDIDLAINADLSRVEFRKKKAMCIANLLRNDFELKVDIVKYNTKDALLFKQIRKSAHRL